MITRNELKQKSSNIRDFIKQHKSKIEPINLISIVVVKNIITIFIGIFSLFLGAFESESKPDNSRCWHGRKLRAPMPMPRPRKRN